MHVQSAMLLNHAQVFRRTHLLWISYELGALENVYAPISRRNIQKKILHDRESRKKKSSMCSALLPNCISITSIRKSLFSICTFWICMMVWCAVGWCFFSGKKNGLPVAEAFGSFTMDLFTPESDLDLSINFNTDTKDLYPRKDKINAIRKLTKILYSHQSNYCSKQISLTSFLGFGCPFILKCTLDLLHMHS